MGGIEYFLGFFVDGLFPGDKNSFLGSLMEALTSRVLPKKSIWFALPFPMQYIS